jgi:hypothetical protein
MTWRRTAIPDFRERRLGFARKRARVERQDGLFITNSAYFGASPSVHVARDINAGG